MRKKHDERKEKAKIAREHSQDVLFRSQKTKHSFADVEQKQPLFFTPAAKMIKKLAQTGGG